MKDLLAFLYHHIYLCKTMEDFDIGKLTSHIQAEWNLSMSLLAHGTRHCHISTEKVRHMSLVILDENLSQMLISMPSAATRNQAVAEESTSPASSIKVPRRESLKTATGLKRKREGDAGPAKESASAKNPQRTATPAGEAGPNGQPCQHREQSSGRRHQATFVPAKRAAGKSRKRAAENAAIPPDGTHLARQRKRSILVSLDTQDGFQYFLC